MKWEDVYLKFHLKLNSHNWTPVPLDDSFEIKYQSIFNGDVSTHDPYAENDKYCVKCGLIAVMADTNQYYLGCNQDIFQDKSCDEVILARVLL